MNSIVSLLLILETEKQEALIESLCEKLVKFREGDRPTLRMQLYARRTLIPSSFPFTLSPFVGLFIHFLICSFICLLPCSPTHSSFCSYSPINPSIPFIHSSICSIIHFFCPLHIHSFTCSLPRSPTRSPVRSLAHPLVHHPLMSYSRFLHCG